MRPAPAGRLGDLRRLVELESPSGDAARLEAIADHLGRWFAPLGTVRRATPGEPHLVVEVGDPGDRRVPLILCHHDTVWPAGTVARRPFRVDDGRAYGPGVLDMKASLVIVHVALETLGPHRGVRVLVTADEEIGNPASSGLVAELACRASAALVMEPPLADGRLKTSRKGHARIRVELVGRAAHAGIEPERGRNAVLAAARVALAAERLGDPAEGTTVNVGVLRGGERANVVPASACLEVDVRAERGAELERVIRGVSAAAQVNGGSAHVASRREPMRRLAATEPLLAAARRVGERIGVPVAEGHTGGVSEGNLAQAAGAPTLDGLGAMGLGAHAEDEHILVRSLGERAALLAGLLSALDQSDMITE